jgi:tRNA modification GTPase
LVDHIGEIVSEISNQVVLLNKIDQLTEADLKKIPVGWIPISVKNNVGFEKLEEALTLVIQKILPQQTQDQDFAINQRHQNSLLKALEHAELAQQGLNNSQPLDMLTIDLRGTVAALRQVTGESLSLDTINQIFARFCVGK